MDTDLNIICDWIPCEAIAAKHLSVGLPDFKYDHPLGFATDYRPKHRDLCDLHTGQIDKLYSDMKIYQLGKCPSCHMEGMDA